MSLGGFDFFDIDFFHINFFGDTFSAGNPPPPPGFNFLGQQDGFAIEQQDGFDIIIL